MGLLKLEYTSISPKQKDMVLLTRGETSVREIQVGDYFLTKRGKLLRIIGEEGDIYIIKNNTDAPSYNLKREAFDNMLGYDDAIYVPEWCLARIVDPSFTDFHNPYFLQSKKENSPYSSVKIREMFEDSMNIPKTLGNFAREINGCYHKQYIQVRWEGFHAGFRLKEDMP